MYDKENVFAKIARGEIDNSHRNIYENEYAMSFWDIAPNASIHALIIPRGPYKNIYDFAVNASADEQAGFWDAFARTAEKIGATEQNNIMANTGDGPIFEQSVPHFHLHLVAGELNDYGCENFMRAVTKK